jgi:hypothetical protein
MFVVLFLLMIVVSFVLSLIEALLVFWIGPNTGISYFDTATYWNIFWLVLIANSVVGWSNASSTSAGS